MQASLSRQTFFLHFIHPVFSAWYVGCATKERFSGISTSSSHDVPYRKFFAWPLNNEILVPGIKPATLPGSKACLYYSNTLITATSTLKLRETTLLTFISSHCISSHPTSFMSYFINAGFQVLGRAAYTEVNYCGVCLLQTERSDLFKAPLPCQFQ